MKKQAHRYPGLGKEIPPAKYHVQIYFEQLGATLTDAQSFFKEQHRRSWRYPNGNPVRNWKALASAWIRQSAGLFTDR